jgi:chromosomal replication initiation ATPase DnaA
MSLLERTETGEWPTIRLPTGPRARARQIISEVAERHRVGVSHLLGPRRFRNLVLARREAAARIANETKIPVLQIAALLCRDNSTIIWAIRRFNEQHGENVRGLGGMTAERLANLRTAIDRSRKTRTREDRLRRSELRKEMSR